jgi:hypothetical protein
MHDFDATDIPALIKAEVRDESGDAIKSRAWIDKSLPKSIDEFGELIHKIADEMFPKKSAPEKPETKTIRGKSK